MKFGRMSRFGLLVVVATATGCTTESRQEIGTTDSKSSEATAAQTRVDSRPPANIAATESERRESELVSPATNTAAPAATQSNLAATNSSTDTSVATAPSNAQPQPPVAPPPVAPKQQTPVTVAQSLEKMDLLSIPRINEKQVLELSQNYVYYSAKSSLEAADALIKTELGTRGWKESESLSTSTEQYVDRNYEKDGMHLRVSVSTGGTAGEIAINMSNLGNVDVRTLPKMPDAEKVDSTATNATHRTSKSIPETIEYLARQMIELGWQPCDDFHGGIPEVPHYRAKTFRQNGVRVNLGVVRDPKNLGEKTTVFYHADIVMPFDIPQSDATLKLDAISHKAKFEFAGDHTELLRLVDPNLDSFAWTILNRAAFEAGENSTLIIKTSPLERIIIGFEEENEKKFVHLQRLVLPKEEFQPKKDEEKIAESKEQSGGSDSSNEDKTKSMVESKVREVESEIAKSIQSELKNALGGLSKQGGAGIPDLESLQSKAMKLLENAEKEGDEDSSNGNEINQVDNSPIEDDTLPIEPADLKIQKSSGWIQWGSKKFEFKHVMAFVKREGGTPTKHILLCSSPMDEKAAKRLLAEGKDISMFDVKKDFDAPSLSLQVTENSVMINASMQGMSLSTNASDIQSTVRYKKEKLHGKIILEKPMQLRDEDFTFHVELNQPVLKTAP